MSNLKNFDDFKATYLSSFFSILGLEKSLETQKEESKEKLSSLEKQMSQVTAELSKLKANDKNAELSEKLSTLGTDLDQKLNTAENKISEFVNTFEKFQSETTQIQDRSIKKLEDVESQVKSFKSTSEGSVQDVMEDAQNLKVCCLFVTEVLQFCVSRGPKRGG